MSELHPAVAEFADYFNNEFTKTLDFDALNNKRDGCWQQLLEENHAALVTNKDHAILDYARWLIISRDYPYASKHLPSEDEVIKSGHLLSMREFLGSRFALSLDPVLKNELWEPMLLKVLEGANYNVMEEFMRYLIAVKHYGNAHCLPSTVMDKVGELEGIYFNRYKNHLFVGMLKLPIFQYSIEQWSMIHDFIDSTINEFLVPDGPALPCKKLIVRDMSFSFHRCRIEEDEPFADSSRSMFIIECNDKEVYRQCFNVMEFNGEYSIGGKDDIIKITTDIAAMLDEYELTSNELIGIDVFLEDI
jgi:hypothetical protein